MKPTPLIRRLTMDNDIDIIADDESTTASFVVSVAKDIAVTVAGTVIGLGLLTASQRVVNKIARARADKKIQENAATAM
jgi:hypothetical protein